METEADLQEAVIAETHAQQATVNAEVARQAVQAKPAELSRTRGDYGAVASLRTFWDFRHLDRATLDLEALRPHLSQEALEKAVRAYIKANFASDHTGQQIKGVEIYQNNRAQVA